MRLAATADGSAAGWTILHGNALKKLVDVAAGADLVVTDPPYSQGATRKEWQAGGSVDAALYAAAHKVKQPGGLMLVCSGSSGRSVDRICGAVAPVLPFAKVLPWIKPFTLSRAAGPWQWHTVLVLVFGRLGGRSRQQDYLVADGMALKRQGATPHPAEMPEAVGKWLASAVRERFMGSVAAPPAQLPRALDPFCGTGSLLAPFYDVGFSCTGIDIEKRWVELARGRRSCRVDRRKGG